VADEKDASKRGEQSAAGKPPRDAGRADADRVQLTTRDPSTLVCRDGRDSLVPIA
jgi:hypothetical protein